jgi:hypothetical protein
MSEFEKRLRFRIGRKEYPIDTVLKMTANWECPHRPTHAGMGDGAADECLLQIRNSHEAGHLDVREETGE